MKPPPPGIILPHPIIRLHVQHLQAVKGHHVKLSHQFVVFRGIACRHNHPALRHLMPSEHLVLQKLQHGGREGFRHTVDFVQKKNPLPDAAFFHHLVYGCDNFTHGILRHVILHALIFPVGNKGKP